MNIGYINPTFLVRRPLAELCRELSSEHAISVLVPKKPFQKFKNTWHNDEALKHVKVITYNAISLSKNFELPIPVDITFFSKLAKMFRENDAVHTWAYFYIQTWLTLIYKLFSRRTQLIISCDTFPGYSFSSGKTVDFLFKAYTTLFGWFLFRVPSTIHLYGNSMKKYALKAGVPKKKITTISTGIHLDKFDNAKKLSKEKLGLKKDSFVLIYGGLLVPRKGIDIMINAMKEVVNENSNVVLLLVGDGPQTTQYKKQAKRLGLQHNIRFLGWRKDIPELLKTSDALLLASRGEGLPGIVMEGMAAQKPIIASNIPCIPDLVENEKNGYLCKKENAQDFAKRIVQLAKLTQQQRNKLGTTSYSKIKQLTWNKLSKYYIHMYKGK